jgi:hypothetical protein
MVPIHESDVAENRWKDSEWSAYELWEKVEVKLRNRRKWIISFTILLFLVLSSLPLIQDRKAKWEGLSVMRKLAIGINETKVEASRLDHPLRVELVQNEDGIFYRVLKVSDCGAVGEEVSHRRILDQEESKSFKILDSKLGYDLSIPGIVQQLCYHPIDGNSVLPDSLPTQAFGILPVKDLTDRRTDRASFVYLTGNSAEISFD